VIAKKSIDIMLDGLVWKELKKVHPGEHLPYATHEGILTIGDCKLRCYQLNDGRRVITEESIMEFFGLTKQEDIDKHDIA
jgi:hypothetical protein